MSIYMKKQFKTNVKCGACVATITPEMEKIAAGSWQVDLTHPDKILTVESEKETDEIIQALESAGYKGELLS
jgi:copper chaperone CopZ